VATRHRGVGGEPKDRIPDLHHRTFSQGSAVTNRTVIHAGAVAAVEVFNQVATVTPNDARVVPRDAGVLKTDVVRA
jgi:hypothetical protein